MISTDRGGLLAAACGPSWRCRHGYWPELCNPALLAAPEALEHQGCRVDGAGFKREGLSSRQPGRFGAVPRWLRKRCSISDEICPSHPSARSDLSW